MQMRRARKRARGWRRTWWAYARALRVGLQVPMDVTSAGREECTGCMTLRESWRERRWTQGCRAAYHRFATWLTKNISTSVCPISRRYRLHRRLKTCCCCYPLLLSRLNTTLPPRIVHAQRPHTQSTTTRPSVHITAHTNTPPPCRACSGSNRLTAALPFDQSLQTAHTKIHHVCSGRGEPPQGRSDGGDDLQVVRSGVFSGSCIMPGSTVVPRHVNSIVWLGWSRARLLSGCPVYKGLGFVATLMLTR
jgi:hypothetical protein